LSPHFLLISLHPIISMRLPFSDLFVGRFLQFPNIPMQKVQRAEIGHQPNYLTKKYKLIHNWFIFTFLLSPSRWDNAKWIIIPSSEANDHNEMSWEWEWRIEWRSRAAQRRRDEIGGWVWGKWQGNGPNGGGLKLWKIILL